MFSRKLNKLEHSDNKAKHDGINSVSSAIGRKKGLLICSLNAPSLLKHKDEIDTLLHDNHIDIWPLMKLD